MLKDLKKTLPSCKVYEKENFFEIILEKEKILEIIKILKEENNLLFDQLIDITAVDYPSKELRFELIYILLSMKKNKRLILKTYVKDGSGIETITSIHKSANWYERECYDLFGIEFYNHPDLRRIMTDYNFEGHPLRKDFPLTGHTEVRYDEMEKKVIYEKVKLTQEFRDFDYVSPWEGIPNLLKGDEKAEEKDNEGN